MFNICSNDPSATSSTLFDAAHQSRVVELLIIYANEIFDISDDMDDIPVTSQSLHDEKIQGVKEKSCYSKASPQKFVHSSPGSENNFRIYKSATCSSIIPRSNQSKANIVEARRQFFTSAYSPSGPQSSFNKYKPFSPCSVNASSMGSKSYQSNQGEDGLSPFSKSLAASSSSQSNFKIKRLTQSNYYPQIEKPSKMYQKNNEMSKSATNISNYSKSGLTIVSYDNQDNEMV